jgi:hypothetical protein
MKSRNGVAPRAVSRIDLAKPVKVPASKKSRSKSEVFGTIARHAGLHRRDVAAVFHTMASVIRA